MIEEMKGAAHAYAKAMGWSSKVGTFFHIYGHSSVNSLHMHVLDMSAAVARRKSRLPAGGGTGRACGWGPGARRPMHLPPALAAFVPRRRWGRRMSSSTRRTCACTTC